MYDAYGHRELHSGYWRATGIHHYGYTDWQAVIQRYQVRNLDPEFSGRQNADDFWVLVVVNSMQSKSRGFTLIELMTVVAVAAILATIAAPSFKNFVVGQRVKSAANEFTMAATLARSEAIKRNSRVGLCVSATGTSCATSGGWEQGWIAYHDANANGVVDTGEMILLRQQAYSNVVLTGSLVQIIYDNNGRMSSNITSAPKVAVTGAGATARCISFDLGGMPRTILSSTGSCS